MIVSVSRRTDIPAFYSEWFLNRVRQGWCLVPNPFNPNQVLRVTLAAAEVDAFVFWSRNPRPLMRYLDELDDMGCRYYFLFTLIGYPDRIDPGSPPLSLSIRTFQELSARVGPQRVIWRYDPIVLSGLSGTGFHESNFRLVAQELKGATGRCVISFVKPYRKARSRMEAAAQGSSEPVDFGSLPIRGLLGSISQSRPRKRNGDILLCFRAGFVCVWHKSVKVHRCGFDFEVVRNRDKRSQGPVPEKRMRVCRQQGYRNVRYLSFRVQLLLCDIEPGARESQLRPP